MNRKFALAVLGAALVAASVWLAVAGIAVAAAEPLVATPAPTAVSIDPITTFPFWGDVTLTGHLLASEMPTAPGDPIPAPSIPLAARGLLIEHSRDGGLTWPDVQWVTTRFDGTWAYIYDPSSSWERNHRVRVSYMGESGEYAASSASVWVSMTLYLSTPTKSVATVYHGKPFVLLATIKPRFRTGIDVARAYFYRRTSTGSYSLVQTVRMRSVYLSTTATTLRHPSILYTAGRYRVRVRYAGGLAAYNGAQFATTYSPYYYFTVK